MKHYLSIVLAGLLFLVSFSAFGRSIALVGGYAYPSAYFNPDPQSTSSHSAALGGGVLLGYTMFPNKVSFELGVLYMPRGYDIKGGTEYTLTTLQLPALFRIYLLRFFNIGLGGYYTHGLGNITVTTPGSTTPASKSYNDLSLAMDDFGMVVCAGIKFQIFRFLSLIADARYMLGLTNLSLGSGTTTLNDMQVLAGVRIGSS